MVLDGYQFQGAFQTRVRGQGVRVLAVDDYGHAGCYTADLVLNQNPHAREELYHDRANQTGLLLGTRFALLRREFWKWSGWKRDVPEVARKVLVTLGGTDPDKATFKVIDALQRLGLPGLDAVIVVGGGNPHLAELEKAAAMAHGLIRLRANVADMPELMAWADVAVAAGGTTTWERALMGLPSLVVILADNQKEVAEALDEEGIGWNLGLHGALGVSVLADALRRLMTDRAARAVDGASGAEADRRPGGRPRGGADESRGPAAQARCPARLPVDLGMGQRAGHTGGIVLAGADSLGAASAVVRREIEGPRLRFLRRRGRRGNTGRPGAIRRWG